MVHSHCIHVAPIKQDNLASISSRRPSLSSMLLFTPSGPLGAQITRWQSSEEVCIETGQLTALMMPRQDLYWQFPCLPIAQNSRFYFLWKYSMPDRMWICEQLQKPVLEAWKSSDSRNLPWLSHRSMEGGYATPGLHSTTTAHRTLRNTDEMIQSKTAHESVKQSLIVRQFNTAGSFRPKLLKSALWPIFY